MATKKKKSNNKKADNSNMTANIVEANRKEYGWMSAITAKYPDDMDKSDIQKHYIPTGSFTLDILTGIGGLPKGRIYLFHGAAGIGKTTTALSLYKVASKFDYGLIYCDFEHRLDLNLVDTIGIDRSDPEKFILSRPIYAIASFDLIEKLLETQKSYFIIIDSISAIDDEKKRMAYQASLLNEFLNRIKSLVALSSSILILISQVRNKLGPVTYKSTSGGEAPRFYATHIWKVTKGTEITKKDPITKKDIVIGRELEWKFEKTNTSMPPPPKPIAIRYGKGFYPEYEVYTLAKEKKIIVESGSWVQYGDISIQGKMNFIDLMEQDKKLFNKIKSELKLK